ncbi:hypothetical protein AVEN_80775-1, partial [Araneus ventricosus]
FLPRASSVGLPQSRQSPPGRRPPGPSPHGGASGVGGWTCKTSKKKKRQIMNITY